MPASTINLQLWSHRLAREMFSPCDDSVLLGPGDDAALVSVSQPKLVLTTDFRSDRNFLSAFEHKGYQHAGRLSVRQNASDVLASGAWPKWFLLSVMLPQDVTRDDIEVLFDGVRDECAKFGVSVVGGDTKQGRSFQICGTMLGETSGLGWQIACAKPGMRLYLTGPVGGVTAALAALSEPALSMLHDEARATLAGAEIPAKLMRRLIDARQEFAATDISDGLGFSIRRMADLNGLVPLLEAERLPRSSFVERVAKAMDLPAIAFAFGYGGDFQFLLAAGENQVGMLEAIGAHRIGKLLHPDEAGAMLYRQQDGILVGKSIPDFGFLDFEPMSDIERFKAHATKFTTL